MLLKIELENFFSIKNRIFLDFIAAKSNCRQARDLSYNVIDWNGTKVLKTIGLFGPNCLSLKKVDSQQRVNNGVFTHPETVQLL